MAQTHREQALQHAAQHYPLDTVFASAVTLSDAEVRDYILRNYIGDTVLLALAQTMG